MIGWFIIVGEGGNDWLQWENTYQKHSLSLSLFLIYILQNSQCTTYCSHFQYWFVKLLEGAEPYEGDTLLHLETAWSNEEVILYVSHLENLFAKWSTLPSYDWLQIIADHRGRTHSQAHTAIGSVPSSRHPTSQSKLHSTPDSIHHTQYLPSHPPPAHTA